MKVFIKGIHEDTDNKPFTHFFTPQPGTAFEAAKKRFDELVEDGWLIISVEIVF